MSASNLVPYYLTLKGVQVLEEEKTIIDTEDSDHYYIFSSDKDRNEFEEFIVNITKKFANNIGWQNVHFPSLSHSLQTILSHVKRECNTGKLPEWAENMLTFEKERFCKWKKFFRTALLQERECVTSLTDWEFYPNEKTQPPKSNLPPYNNSNNNQDNNHNEREIEGGITNFSNPYLIFFLKMMEIFEEKYNTDLLLVFRQCAMRQFAYSIPSLSLLSYIRKISQKIFEIGAGSGYWAKMLQVVGCDVVACDDFSDGLEQSYFNVINRNADQLLEEAQGTYDDHALLFCWPRSYPGYRYWKGDVVIVICEENGRPDFLGVESKEQVPDQSEWMLESSIPILHWPHVPEMAYFYRKKSSSC